MAWWSIILSNVLLASLLAAIAWLVQRRLRRPALARFLWVVVLVKLITPPLVGLPIHELPGVASCTLGTCGCDQHAAFPALGRGNLPWILLAVWSAGTCITIVVAWRRWMCFRRLVRFAVPAPQPWQSLTRRLASELSMRRAPEILAVAGRVPPFVFASWWRPRIVIPLALLEQLNTSQRSALLLHELVHIKRGDHLVRMLEVAVGVIYWWLPVVGAGVIGRQLRASEEACCDAAVVAHLPHARREYARLLLDVLDFADPAPLQSAAQATAMSAAGELQLRLRSILDAPRQARRNGPAGALALGLACLILPCELRYDRAPLPAPQAAAELERPQPKASPSSGDRDEDRFAVACCPS